MNIALQHARLALKHNEIPVGAVIVYSGKVIATAHNLVNTNSDCTQHAEFLVIREAMNVFGCRFLLNCDLYTTLEPCIMCGGAISLARIKNLYFGAYDSKTGSIYNGPRIYESKSCHHKPVVYGGIMEKECTEMIKNFFQEIRCRLD